MSLAERTLLAWYGDDFTGSAAVMEELAFAGVETVLFLRVPSASERRRFASAQAVGLAGTARAHSPSWMREHLSPVFTFLRSLNAELNLYKICSTLDSSPDFGSIGAAIALARVAFGERAVPVFPASPKMGRFQCFGNLFASARNEVYRLDRHPVMSHHPVTPMNEADVARHLARQTDEPIGRIMLPDLPAIEAAWATVVRAGHRLITIDAWNEVDLIHCGRLFASLPSGSLIAGSQGVAEALVALWRSNDDLPITAPESECGSSSAMVALSGSLSPTTTAQIAQALDDGFTYIGLDTVACLGDGRNDAVDNATQAALAALAEGQVPLIASARSSDDPAVAEHRRAADTLGFRQEAASQAIGESLGVILGRLVALGAVERIAVAGGDTSGYVMRQLDALALTGLAPITPGAGLYRLHARDESNGSLEVSLKGGQMGSPKYFSDVRGGGVQ